MRCPTSGVWPQLGRPPLSAGLITIFGLLLSKQKAVHSKGVGLKCVT